MRTRYRVGFGLLALGSALPLGLGSAAADTVIGPKISQSNYYWFEQQGGAAATVPGQGDVPNPAANQAPSSTPAGDIGIAYTHGTNQRVPTPIDPLKPPPPPNPAQNDEPDKIAFLQWDLSAVPADATVTSFTFTLIEDNSTPAASAYSEPPPLIACASKNAWSESNFNGSQYSGKPNIDCTSASIGKFDTAKKAYTFEVKETAQGWIDSYNIGLGIRHKLGYTTPFQVSAKVSDITAKITFSVPPVVTPSPSLTVPPVPQPTVPAGGGGGVVGGPPVYATDPGVPQPAPAPVPVTAPQPGSGQAVPFVAAAFTHDTGIPAALWIAVLTALVLLALASLVLGDSDVPVPGMAVEGNVTRVLRQRHRASTSTLRTRSI